MGCQQHAPAVLPPGKKHDTHCIGGSMDPRAGLDGCGKSRLHRVPIPGPFTPCKSLYRLSYPGPPHRHANCTDTLRTLRLLLKLQLQLQLHEAQHFLEVQQLLIYSRNSTPFMKPNVHCSAHKAKQIPHRPSSSVFYTSTLIVSFSAQDSQVVFSFSVF